MTRTVGIIGAGIGGLTSAVALTRAGWRVTVFERGGDLTGAGTALGIWPSATRSLDAIGLGDRVRRSGVAQVGGTFRRPDGSTIGSLAVDDLRRRTGDPVYLLSRPALVGMLAEALPAGCLRLGEPVHDVPALAAEFDLVVAADGVFGRSRAALLGDGYPARYAGMTVWRGWIDAPPPDALVEVWGRGRKFGVTPQEGGRTNWYAAVVAPEPVPGPTTEADIDMLNSLYGSWPEPIPGVLAALTADGVLRHGLHVVPRLPTFVRGTVALIGDAAHAMTPDLGRGAGEAITDAIALSHAVDHDPDVARALRRYDARRRPATQRLATASWAAGRLARQRRGLWLRDALLTASLRLPMAA